MEEEKKVLYIEIDTSRYAEVQSEAKKLGVPVASFIKLLLAQYFDDVRFERVAGAGGVSA